MNVVLLKEGSYDNISLQQYNRNILVAVKRYKSNDLHEIIHEVETIHILQKEIHKSFPPMLIGVNTDAKPFLMATQIYGKESPTWTLGGAFEEGNILHCRNVNEILSGVNFVHAKGFLHNDIKQNNSLLYRSPSNWNAVLVEN